MHLVRRSIRTLALSLAVTSVAHRVVAQQPDSATLEERLEALDQRVRVLQRLRELADDSIAAAAKARPNVTANANGFSISSGDNAYQLRIRGYAQIDGRFYAADRNAPATNSFVLRRVRPILEGTLANRFDFRFMPDFGQGTVRIFDVYGETRISPALGVRIGKFKPPIGLERLQSGTDLRFIERGFATNLAPNRDVGLQLGGAFAGGVVSYQAGVFNGVPDLGNGDTDTGDSKDVAGRIFFQPFLSQSSNPTVDLGIGIAGSHGTEFGTAAVPAVAAYLTPGQQSFFRYRSDGTVANTVIAAGDRTRIAPQGYLYVGPLGLLGEYTRSTQQVQRATSTADLAHTAWQISGGLQLTGERASFRSLTPRKIFDPDAGTWGALQLDARYGAVKADDAAFPLYANPATTPSKEQGWGVGITWHLFRNIKLILDYDRTNFTGGTASGNRDPESFISTRFQTSF